MLESYLSHNLYWKEIRTFEKEDPNLSGLRELKFVHPLDWWHKIDWKEPGIYILTGGRQIGKTTSVKLLIQRLLTKGVFSPKNSFYFPCDEVFDQKQLSQTIRFFLQGIEEKSPFLLVIDEVTFVEDWDRVIKALADEAWFRRGFCILTGSDSMILKEAASRFPGRRGKSDRVDFHLYPLTFGEYLQLVDPGLFKEPQKRIGKLFEAFSSYLQCGGHLRAINDLHSIGEIREATCLTLEQWIRGDFLKRGKSEENLLSVLQALVEIGVSQTSYSNLHRRADLLSKESFLDYCRLLERMDILFNLQAFDQNKRRGFPKKDRKFHFGDPFVRNTVERWLLREHRLKSRSDESVLVENAVAAQYYAKTPAYYVKGEGEIDLLLLRENKPFPIEVKWSHQIRAKDLIQLKKFRQSAILTKREETHQIEGMTASPLPLFLLENPV